MLCYVFKYICYIYTCIYVHSSAETEWLTRLWLHQSELTGNCAILQRSRTIDGKLYRTLRPIGIWMVIGSNYYDVCVRKAMLWITDNDMPLNVKLTRISVHMYTVECAIEPGICSIDDCNEFFLTVTLS